MRIAAVAGLFAFVAVVTASGSSVSAEAFDFLKANDTKQTSMKISSVSEPIVLLASIGAEKPQPEPIKPEPKIHEVQPGETLSSIADLYQTTWNRLFNKNEQISHPDVIKTGDKLVIPAPEEVLADRPLPAAPTQASGTAAVTYTGRTAQASAGASGQRGASTGNTYTPGYCTWYAKNMRPDLPNNLGNADTWVSRAAAQGIPTGSVPHAGAIGQQGMHVVYVERVNDDGTVYVSEMNFQGLYVVSSRTVPASTFMYIY